MRLKLASNRIQCLLKLNRFREATDGGIAALDGDKKGSNDTIKIKIRFRTAQGFTEMGRFRESLKMLDSLKNCRIDERGMKSSINELFSRTTRKLKESIDPGMKSKKSDVTNYYNPRIKIKFIDNTVGRGVVATNNLKAGKCILKESVLAFGGRSSKHVSAQINWQRMRSCKGDHINLNQNIVKLFRTGSYVDKYRISQLYCGSKAADTPSIDVFRYYELPEGVLPNHVLLFSIIRKIPMLSTS